MRRKFSPDFIFLSNGLGWKNAVRQQGSLIAESSPAKFMATVFERICEKVRVKFERHRNGRRACGGVATLWRRSGVAAIGRGEPIGVRFSRLENREGTFSNITPLCRISAHSRAETRRVQKCHKNPVPTLSWLVCLKKKTQEKLLHNHVNMVRRDRKT